MKTILIATASAVALAGCASPGTGPRTYSFDPRNPKVYVVENDAARCEDRKSHIVVDQEPIYFFRRTGAQAFPIIWHLQTRDYSFVQDNNIGNPPPRPGSPPGEIHSCRAGGNTMQCTNNAQRSGAWKYTLRIAYTGKCGQSPPDLDPIIAND